ncbi:MAG: 1-acyl-sn-glycerol-3-phosphate acyltransferase [Flavobacteriales bacterium]|jgi:1-acyl-sn-glycerol-3-phosphate acyltransferase|nr:1-acyl-sn-glycerol-3-phosphate acyltransferase [Flavobacteriales bacterium]MBQ5815490.1 1-acyl-sn-glycerol-3-phosphate acyltransferase [Flavobacteriales bacterium]
MKTIHDVVQRIWRTWAALMAFLVTLILSIPLLISVSTPRFYGFFSVLARIWSFMILLLSGFIFSIKGGKNIDYSRQYMIVSNHSSAADIMLSYLSVPLQFVFVGKAELAKIPVFGAIYKGSNILVDRRSLDSRRSILPKAKAEIARGRSIFIYPEGTTKHHTRRLMPFKDGAFVLAIDCGIPILPVTFLDNVELFPSDELKGHPGLLRAVIDKPIETKGMSIEDKERLKEEVFNIIDSRLAEAGR